MSKLENLVPPLELCKLIPAGEFEDSCFVRVPRSNGVDYQLSKRTAFIESAHKCYPAPTLEEIMAAMPYCQIYRRKNGSFVGCYALRWDQKVSGETGSTAALKMWLKFKGIEG